MEESDRIKLQESIDELDSYRGRHTELVSVYIPAEANINQTISQLISEQSTAQNIKSKSTRKNVIDALERLIRHLRLYKKLPENGLALFCGNISKVEGQDDIKIWAIEPPFALKVKFYRCDQTFVLVPLKDMLESKEVYGLIVIDKKEATFGILAGKMIKVLRNITSGIPSKHHAGGQCLNQNSLIMLNDGEITEIKNTHNPLNILSCELGKQKTNFSKIKMKWGNEKQIFKVITKYPTLSINASPNHLFFVRTDNGIAEKPLSEIKEGDYLIMPEKVNIELKDKRIQFNPQIKRRDNIKKIRIPKIIDGSFARLLGYYLGDGSYEIDRINFFEQRKDVAEYYKKLIKKVFGIESKLKFRKDKNYYQIRVYSRIISQLFKHLFQSEKKTLNERIPSIILKSSNKSLASFIAGFFDAEGYISSNRISLGINNEIVVRQLQMALLRFGIISSINEYDNRKNPYSNKIRYTISIDDAESVKKFFQNISFSSKEKTKKLVKLISIKRIKNNTRQILITGKEIRELFRKYNYKVYQFGLSGFFSNKRQLNKKIFKERLIDGLSTPSIKKELIKYYNSELIPVKIKKILPIGKDKTIDIETSSSNFISNCILVHNSSQRFERAHEEMTKEFYRRTADNIKELFFEMPHLQGLLLGGPGPTKEDFLKEGKLVTQLQKKILAVKDIGYADEHGLKLLIEASQDVLLEESITKEKKILDKFFTSLASSPEKTAYGLENVKKALQSGSASHLLISSAIERKTASEFERLARQMNTEIFYISIETNEGLQFKNIGGIGAILRYASG